LLLSRTASLFFYKACPALSMKELFLPRVLEHLAILNERESHQVVLAKILRFFLFPYN